MATTVTSVAETFVSSIITELPIMGPIVFFYINIVKFDSVLPTEDELAVNIPMTMGKVKNMHLSERRRSTQATAYPSVREEHLKKQNENNDRPS